MLVELGEQLDIRSLCDSSAARGILTRAGAGRVRHLELIQLWVQEHVADGKVRVQWLPRKQNPADALIHGCTKVDLARHWGLLQMHFGL